MSSLAFLSLARVGHRKVPHVPSNTERLQAFRRYQPAQFGNNSFNGGGVLGVNVVRREAANNHEARCPASTFSPPSPGPNQPQTAGRRLLSSKEQSA